MERRRRFDPEVEETRMMDAGMIGERPDPPSSPLGGAEDFYTEYDDRKYALWRLSMERQFQPWVLRQLNQNDLLFLAGQTSAGFENVDVVAQHSFNKLAQNAQRAAVELEARSRRGTFYRSVALLVVGTVLGAGTSYALTRDDGHAVRAPASTTSTVSR